MAHVTDGDAPISLNETASPQLPPRGCIGVLAVINTNDIPSQSILTITTTARSNATNAVNGRGQDDGTIVNAVGLGARLTDPTNSSLAPSKLINGVAQTVVNQAGEFIVHDRVQKQWRHCRAKRFASGPTALPGLAIRLARYK